MNTTEEVIADLPMTGTTQRGRKIPVGLRYMLAPFAYSGTTPIGIGFLILVMAFKWCGFAITIILPWYWSDAGTATVTEVERIHNHINDQAADRIVYVYYGPQGVEHKGVGETSKKIGFFVVGQRYPILKYDDNWRYTVLTDLSIWERDSFLTSNLKFCGLAIFFVVFGLFTNFAGRRISQWKRELLQHGTYASGTFSHDEPAPIYGRILGLKRSVCIFETESGEQCVALFIRRQTKKEGAEVDVFYDPANPFRSFVLQALVPRKHAWYSPETNAIVCSRFMSAAGGFMKAVEYFFWLSIIWFSIRIVFF